MSLARQFRIECKSGKPFDIQKTNADGKATLRITDTILNVTVKDQDGLPVKDATVEGFDFDTKILLFAGSESHFPGIKIIEKSGLTSLSYDGRLQPQVITVAPVMLIISAVGLGLTVYDYLTNPGEFPLQIPGLIEGHRRVKSICIQIDGNDILAIGSLVGGLLEFVKRVGLAKQVFGAPAKLRGVTSINSGFTWAKAKNMALEEIGLAAAQASGILDQDLINGCTYEYETNDGVQKIPYTKFEVTRSSIEPGCIDGYIWDSKTGAPIKDVEVLASGQQVEFNTTTDRNGYYKITDLRLGKYWLVASKQNYRLATKDVTLQQQEGCKRVDFKLEPLQSPPVANFDASPSSGLAPLTVQFQDKSTGEITSHFWEFGDGGTSTDKNPSHTYNKPGSYPVKLTVKGPGGEDTETKTSFIKVQEEICPTPSGLKVKPISTSEIMLEWPYSWQYVTHFQIERKGPDGKVQQTVVFNKGSQFQTFKDTGLTAGKKYCYKVLAISLGGSGCVSKYSEEECATPQGANQLTFTVTCPVDIEVTDPDGLVIDKRSSQIPGATYTEKDLNGDGDPDDQIVIPDRKIGDYQVRVIAEPRAKPTDTYTLEIAAGTETTTVAKEAQIKDIPDKPYTFTSKETVLSIEEAIDENNNNLIDDSEILKALRYWISGEEVPGTGGQTIDDATMLELLHIWTSRRPISSASAQSEPIQARRTESLTVREIKLSPNPVKSTYTATFRVEGLGIAGIKVEVFNLAGMKVSEEEASSNTLKFYALDDRGRPLANGVYLYVVTVRGFNGEAIRSDVRKLVILR